MQLHKDLREFVELLNSNEVEYVVVGAHPSPTPRQMTVRAKNSETPRLNAFEIESGPLYDPKLSVRNTIDKRQRGSLHERQDRILVLTLETNHDDSGVRDRIIRLNVGKSEIECNENAPFRFGLLSQEGVCRAGEILIRNRMGIETSRTKDFGGFGWEVLVDLDLQCIRSNG